MFYMPLKMQLYYLVRITFIRMCFSSGSKIPIDQEHGLTVKQKTVLRRDKNNAIAKAPDA